MKITVLGNCGPYPGKDRACSGYLVEHGKAKILLDCGCGVIGKLQNYCQIEQLTHIFLSHLHYDHMNDIMVLRYAIQGKIKRGSVLSPIKLYLTNEPKEIYEKIISKDIFKSKEINENLKVNIEDLYISFVKVNHPINCYAIKIECKEKTFVYSGDTAYSDLLINFAKDADILLCDAGLLKKDKKQENAPHLTAYETGITAKQARVKKLLLTHFWPEDDVNQHLLEARENYPNVELAVEGKIYNV